MYFIIIPTTNNSVSFTFRHVVVAVSEGGSALRDVDSLEHLR